MSRIAALSLVLLLAGCQAAPHSALTSATLLATTDADPMLEPTPGPTPTPVVLTPLLPPPASTTSVDLGCTPGGTMLIRLMAPPAGPVVAKFGGTILKGGSQVGTFMTTATANQALLAVQNMGGGMNYSLRIWALDATGAKVNLHAPGYEAIGPLSVAAGTTATASLLVP